MDTGQFDAEMRALCAALAGKRAGEATERAITLEASLRREASPPGAQLGWARFYAIRAAYAGGDRARARDLLLSFDETRHIVPDENRAWLYSVGCELAAALGDVEDIDAFGERCYQLRRALGSPGCALRCALLVCRLLSRAGALATYPRWPQRVIAIGRTYGATTVVRIGKRYARGLRNERVPERKLRSR